MSHIIVFLLFVSSFCISSSLHTSKIQTRLQVSSHSSNHIQPHKNMDLFFKRDSMESGFSPVFKEKSIEFSSLSKSEYVDYEESQTLLSASASSSGIDEEAPSKGLLPPWLPSFTTACLGGLLFGSDIGTSKYYFDVVNLL